MSNNSDLRRSYNFHSLKSFAEAEVLAAQAQEEFPTETILAYDYGPSTSPRYGIFYAFKVGQKVSYGFNGDYYPTGTVEQIGKDHKRIKANGEWYYRRKLTPYYQKAGGTWTLIEGHHDERNPSF